MSKSVGINSLAVGGRRSPNYELVRIFAMFFIVLGHLFSLSGTFWAYFPAIQSVDCFILITGFFLIKSKFRSERFYKVLIETIFYAGGITLLLFFIQGNVSIYDLLKSFYPLGGTKFTYWFVHNYLALIILYPFLRKSVSTLSKREYQLLLVALTALCTTFIPATFPLGFCSAWSLWWFVCLFLFGGYLRLYSDELPVLPWGKMLLGLMLFCILRHKYLPMITYEYNSIHALAMAICTFMWIKNWKISANGWIAKGVQIISPHTFGVYLIHSHVLLQPIILFYIKDWQFQGQGFWVNTLYSLVITISVFLLCVMVDKLRVYFFQLIRLEKFTEIISTATDKKIAEMQRGK